MGLSEVPAHLAHQMKRVFGPGHAGYDHWDFEGPGSGVADGDGGSELVDMVTE